MTHNRKIFMSNLLLNTSAQKKLIWFFITIGIFAMSLNTCSYAWKHDTGNLTIIFGENENARSFVQQSELDNFAFTIQLTGPGESIQESFNFNKAQVLSFNVAAGIWNISVKGLSNDCLKLMGIEQVQIKPGQEVKRKIKLYTAREVKSWTELNDAVSANDPAFIIDSIIREELFVIKESFELTDFSILSPSCTITIKRPIILIAENDVTISRKQSGTNTSFFKVDSNILNNGCLTLGINGMPGKSL